MKIDSTKYALVAHAAELLGVARTTLDSAVRSGKVDYVTMAGGTVLVSLVSARKWHQRKRASGRPKVN